MSIFDTHGGHFAPKDYTIVNEGGSHEENPNGGVQLGVDPEGAPNLLEEGEPVYKDYVFSDNIKAKESFLEENNLPLSYRDKLYSEIADLLVDEAEERPLDPISRNGLNAMLSRLAQAQEGQKAEKQQRELEKMLKDLTPEELDALEASMIAAEEQPVEPMPVAPQEVAPEQVSPEQIPMMAYGGKVRKFALGGPGGDEWDYKISKLMPLPPILDPSVATAYTMQDLANDTFKPVGNPFGVDLSSYAETVPEENFAFISPVSNASKDAMKSIQDAALAERAKALTSRPQSTTLAGNRPIEKHDWLDAYKGIDTEDVDIKPNTSSVLPTFSRYAKAIGSGLLGLYDLFQKPDHYTATRAIPYAPSGSINLQTQKYVPVDPNIILNEQLAQSNATARALNNGSPSTAANLLALDNNTTRNIGTGYLQGVQANNQQRNAVIGANNQAEAQRAQFDYNVDRGRVMGLDMAQRQNLHNELLLQQLNNEAESAKYAALSNQINTGLDALSGIGRENFVFNQINTNPYNLGYGYAAPNGVVGYRPVVFGKCGGFLKKYQK